MNDVTALETVLGVCLEAWRFRKLLGDVELVAGVEAGALLESSAQQCRRHYAHH